MHKPRKLDSMNSVFVAMANKMEKTAGLKFAWCPGQHEYTKDELISHFMSQMPGGHGFTLDSAVAKSLEEAFKNQLMAKIKPKDDDIECIDLTEDKVEDNRGDLKTDEMMSHY